MDRPENAYIPLYVFEGEREVEEEGRSLLLSVLCPEKKAKYGLTLMNRERVTFLRALKDAREKGLKHALFIADTSTTVATAATISKLLHQSMKSKAFDLLYLCKWMDRSNLYTERQSLLGTISIARTHAPHGMQALLIQASGIEAILSLSATKSGTITLEAIDKDVNQRIHKGYLVAYCLVPNLLHFNLLRAESASDYDRLREASVPSDSNENAKVASNTAYLWFVFATLVVIIIIWVVFKLPPGDS